MAVKINLMPEKFQGNAARLGERPPFHSLAFSFFIIALVVYSAMFVYQNYFQKKELSETQAKKESLNAEIAGNLDPQFVAAGKKAKNTEKILAEHLYWTKFYALLESLTLKNVSYKSFSAEGDIFKDGAGSVKIEGETIDFKTLATQLSVLRESKDISGVGFDKARLEKDGKVNFGLEAGFNSSVIKFKTK